MNNKKLIGWMIGIPVFVILLIVFIVWHEPEKDGIARADAFKAAALAFTTRDDCESLQKKLEEAYFPVKEQDNWYVKYMDFLYEKEYLSEELTPPGKETAEGWLTYGEVEFLAEAVSANLAADLKVTKKNRGKPISKEQWWWFYDALRKEADPEGHVVEETLLLFGTPQNVEGSKKWMAYTSAGDFGFEGLAMDTYIDREIRVLYRGTEIITVREMTSEDVTYENVWLASGDSENFTVYVGSISRSFAMNASLGKTEDLVNNLADVHLKKGKLEKIVLKKERITGKVLSVKENAIEIEGYGDVTLDEGFKVFKVYGGFKRQRITDILVGYDIQEFVVANGKICAALTVRAFDAKSIRVLLMNTGFDSIFHQSILFSSDYEVIMLHGEEEEVIHAGEEVTIQMDDERLKDGRIILQMQSAEGSIRVHTIERALGIPAYAGRLEIKKEKDGLVLVNELYLEDYLTKVVPSEMPGSYEKEALKAQAVCARTYAYRQIQGNTYSQYGAHVDDSTRFQVYNNIATDSKTQEAVSETYGRMLLYEGDPVEAYYFSTSSGHTTDGTVWGADAAQTPYLQGYVVNDSRKTMNLTTNEDFAAFIKDKSYATYETGFPLYRWELKITNLQLAEKITGIGTILNMTVTERGVGGIGKKLRVEGSDGTKVISGQGQIRTILGNKAVEITNNKGEILTGWDTLPSAFIAVEVEGIDENNVTTFHIYGGGYGHGAGMSQNGAQGMAKAGKDYIQILKFFYDGVEVSELDAS